MKFIKILDELSSENSEIKFNIQHISYKKKRNDKDVIESLTKIAYIFYVLDDIRNAELVSNKLASIPFENDYDYWTWIEYAISLRAELAQLDGDSKKFNNSIAKINDALDTGEGLHKKIRNNVYNRFMTGDGIELDESVLSGKNENLIDIFDFRLIFLMKLIKVKVLGGSVEYPFQLAVENIDIDIKEMKTLLVDVDDIFKEIRPFK